MLSSTGLDEFNFFHITPLKSLNLVLIPVAKLDGHRGSWTVCIIVLDIGFVKDLGDAIMNLAASGFYATSTYWAIDDFHNNLVNSNRSLILLSLMSVAVFVDEC